MLLNDDIKLKCAILIVLEVSMKYENERDDLMKNYCLEESNLYCTKPSQANYLGLLPGSLASRPSKPISLYEDSFLIRLNHLLIVNHLHTFV